MLVFFSFLPDDPAEDQPPPILPHLQLLGLLPSLAHDSGEELYYPDQHTNFPIPMLTVVLPLIPASCCIMLVGWHELHLGLDERGPLIAPLTQLTGWLERGGRLCASPPGRCLLPPMATRSTSMSSLDTGLEFGPRFHKALHGNLDHEEGDLYEPVAAFLGALPGIAISSAVRPYLELIGSRRSLQTNLSELARRRAQREQLARRLAGADSAGGEAHAAGATGQGSGSAQSGEASQPQAQPQPPAATAEEAAMRQKLVAVKAKLARIGSAFSRIKV